MPTVTVTIPTSPSYNYPVVIAAGATSQISALVNDHPYDQAIIIYDQNLQAVAEQIANQLKSANLIAVPAGEGSKNLAQVEVILKKLLSFKVTRHSLIINVGGGMLTDLGAFVASIYMRGLAFINVPTSLLAMVDAGLGGKTGVDLAGTKNIVGTFASPLAIVIDTKVLSTLPQAALPEGLVEVIKMAAILDAQAFTWLEKSVTKILKKDADALQQCLQVATQMKAAVVTADVRDTGPRQLLNFGHTVAHALEAASNFAISHGQAVAIGMVVEMSMVDSTAAKRVLALLKQLDLPTQIPSYLNVNELWQIMQNDKKNIGSAVKIAVATELGQGEVMTITKAQFTAAAHV